MLSVSKLVLFIICPFLGATWMSSPGKGSHAVAGNPAPVFKAVIEESLGTITTSQSLATTLSLASGDLVVVGVSGTVDATAIDVGGQAATKIGVNTAGGISVAMWYVANTSANATALVTITAAGSNFVKAAAASYSGAKTASVLEQNACNVAGCNATSTNTDHTTQNVTTTQANQILVAWDITNDNKTTQTAGSNWNVRTGAPGGGKNWCLLDRGVTSAGTYPNATTLTVNSTGDNGYYQLIATFKGL